LSESPASTPTPPAPDPRGLMTIYVAGFFSMGMLDLFAFLVPLYGIMLGFDAFEVGLLVGSRGILSMVFAIHAGSCMDRLGTKRVTLLLVAGAICLAPLYPALPHFWALLGLQVISGCTVSLNYTGTQTLIAQIGRGEAEYIGRYSFATRMGTATAPIAVGLVWDFAGLWPSFIFVAAWGVALFIAVSLTPNPGIARGHDHDSIDDAPPPFRFRDALPRWSDYAGGIAMMAIPAVAVTMAVVVLRNATSGIQGSVYVVYVEGIGMTGTMIGILFAAIEGASGVGALFGGRAARLFEPQRLMVVSTCIAIALICISPLLGGVFALLLIAKLARGFVQGVMQPVMFSVQSKAVGAHRQGAIVGVRQTANRIAAMGIPPLMGWIADRWGVEESFYILGAGLLAIGALLYWAVTRLPRLDR
jgi:MFS family permease